MESKPKEVSDMDLGITWRRLEELNDLVSELPGLDGQITEAKACGQQTHELEREKKNRLSEVEFLGIAIGQVVTPEHNPYHSTEE